jgi:FtsP/CotA-like multicopper oxidase with cupredoxin domain
MDPPAHEDGWKDTLRMNPHEVTRIIVRFAPTDIPVGRVSAGDNFFGFDPTKGPGYVWHCHIIDHEDNEMMRPYKVKK